jgi:CBS domain-containing protein
MIIGEITSRNTPTIGLTATLQEAGAAMRGAGSGVLLVLDDRRLIGTLSERDLAVQGCDAGLDPRYVKVSAIFNRNPAVCAANAQLKSALKLMRERRQPWLVVLDDQGLVAGIAFLMDLLEVFEDLVQEVTDGPEPEFVRRVRGGATGE